MRKKPTASFGDVASDFLQKWNSSRTVTDDENDLSPPIPLEESARAGNEKRRGLLDSWKKGGEKVRVTKVVSKSGITQSDNCDHQRSTHRNEGLHQAFNSKHRHANKSLSPGTKPALGDRTNPPVASNSGAELPHGRSARYVMVGTNPARPPIPPQRTLHDRLRDVCADLRVMKINSAASTYVSNRVFGQIVEGQSPTTAILGLDFGTAFTKAVIRWKGGYHAVDWSLAVNGESPYLLSSAFSEYVSGECVLGINTNNGWQIRDGIKLKILDSTGAIPGETLADAVIFIALAFRYSNHWLRQSLGLEAESILWKLHVGLPTLSWNNNETASVYSRIAKAAWRIAQMPGMITRESALHALSESVSDDTSAAQVFPEFACQLYSYLRSPERWNDLHALVDIGAGTVDVAFFNVHSWDGGPLLPIFAADVQNLGAHYLISALAGPSGGNHPWSDSDSRITIEECARIVGDSPDDVSKRRSIFLSAFADVFNSTRARARSAYETSPVFSRNAPMRLFACGGGSRIPAYRERIDLIARQSEEVVGVRFLVSNLVRPRDINGGTDLDFDRLSVAYGLSQVARNIGAILRSNELAIIPQSQRPARPDRDDDR